MAQQDYALLEIQSDDVLNQHPHPTKKISIGKKCVAFLLFVVVFCLGILIGRITAHCDCSVASTPTSSSTPTTSPTASPTSSKDALAEIQLAQSVLTSLGLDKFTYLFDHKKDLFFDFTLNDYEIFGGKITATPKGWVKFALNTAIHDHIDSKNISNWSKAYHGTLIDNIFKIFASNLTLLKTGDTIPGTNITLQPRDGHITTTFTRNNEYTNEMETFDPNQVFMSPSIRYSENIVYTQEHILNVSGDKIGYKVVFEVAIRNVSGIGQSTTTGDYLCSDGIIQNNQIEWYTKRNLYDIVLTGLLITTRKVFQWKTVSSAWITVNDVNDTITRTSRDNGALEGTYLDVVSSGYYEWLFLIKNMNNTDDVIFGIIDETNAYYLWTAHGKKRYLASNEGNSWYAPNYCTIGTKVKMIVDLYKYEMRLVVNGVDFDVAFQLPEREIEYRPAVWLGNDGDEIQLV